MVRLAMNAREDAAKRLQLEPANIDLARRWVAASYLVAQADSCSTTAEIVPPPLELLRLAEEAIRIGDRLEALRKDNLEVLKDGTLVYTEKERLREVPSSVRRGITAEVGEGWTALNDLEKLCVKDHGILRNLLEPSSLCRVYNRSSV